MSGAQATGQTSTTDEARRRNAEKLRLHRVELEKVSNALRDATARIGPLATAIDETIATLDAVLPKS